MLDDYAKGFLSGLLFCLIGIIFISCTITPLDANNIQECGISEWNPCYVKIVQ